MNVVFVSRCDPFDVYLIRKLQEQQLVGAILRVVQSPSTTSSRFKRLRRAPLQTMTAFAERQLFRKRFRHRIEQQASCRLFGSSTPPALEDGICLDVPAHSINAPATVEMLRQLAPDVVLVSTAPLLQPAIYSIPPLGTVNVHWGIVPAYRGEDSLFWAMYFGDYNNLGVTLHYVDEGIDTGPVLAHGFPALNDHESEASLIAKCAQSAVELLLEFLSVARFRKPEARPFSGPGRLFRARDRRVWHDAQLWYRRKLLRASPPARSLARAIYFQPAATAESAGP